MTEITIANDHGLKTIKIEGHCGYSPAGTDIVCAGVSALCQAYAFYLEELSNMEKAIVIRMFMTDGYYDVCSKSDTPEAEAAFEMLITGLEGIKNAYPEYINIDKKNFLQKRPIDG